MRLLKHRFATVWTESMLNFRKRRGTLISVFIFLPIYLFIPLVQHAKKDCVNR